MDTRDEPREWKDVLPWVLKTKGRAKARCGCGYRWGEGVADDVWDGLERDSQGGGEGLDDGRRTSRLRGLEVI
jgi:hypothetical protein